MFVLAVDTATPAVTAGVVEYPSGRVLAHRVTVDARRHVEALLPQIQECLRELELRPTDIDAVVSGIGPGPFTGLRVGMVTAQTFADAIGVPLYGVCSLDAMAADTRGEGPLLVATDARRKEVYWATYGADGERLLGPEVSKPAALRELIDQGQVVAAGACGSALALYGDVLGLPEIESGVSHPTPAGLVRAAARRLDERAPGESPSPLYLRRPDVTLPVA